MWKLAIIEDDPFLLQALKDFLDQQEHLECVLATSTLGHFFERWDTHNRLDVLLLDILLGEHNSLDHLTKIRRLAPHCKIIVITGVTDPSLLLRALETGADSYYRKGSDLEKLLDVIDLTLRGGAYIDPEVAPEVINFFRNRAENKNRSDQVKLEQLRAIHQLSEREVQVARGLITGHSYEAIGDSLNIALNTVRHYVKTLYRKLEINNKVQLIQKLQEVE